MQFVRMNEDYLKKANPAKAAKLREITKTLGRLIDSVPAFDQRLGELDALIAAPKAKAGADNGSAWEIAMEGLDAYGGDPRRELVEERDHITDSKRFNLDAAEQGMVPWGSLWGQISNEITNLERPAAVKDIQVAIDGFMQGLTALKKLQARRDRLEKNGVRTDSLPCCVAPEVGEHIEIYFRWIKANFPEVKVP